jgi:glycine/D-amino acid oxidase-like deaminating enzyme
MRNGDVSFWYADMGGLPRRRPALDGDQRADVCIVGAGFTGLWTAYYLKRAQPSLAIILLEAEFAGFGASGRNGGWLTGSFGWPTAHLEAESGQEGVRALKSALLASVDEVAAVAGIEGIEADLRRVDELLVATNPSQMQRLRCELRDRRAWKVTNERVHLIGPEDARNRVAIPALHGALVIGGQGRVQPAKLVTGLAAAVERQGSRIYEGSVVTAIAPGSARTATGTVHAPVILRATEGFTAALPGHRRDLLPLNSAQIVTAPLPPALWDRIGWRGHEILGDAANGYFYAQRTRDGRIAMGGRGLPYRYGSRIDRGGATDPATLAYLTGLLHRHFPDTRGLAIDHAWCGVLGVPRDWTPSVFHDPATGLGWAGGYVGTGVATSNLAGRTLADLVLGRNTDLSRLPIVNRRSRKWEPEPLRWLGVRSAYALLYAADRREARQAGSRTALAARIAGWLTG